MCDFSLHAARSRPAKVGDKLTTRMFDMGTTGFCAPEDNRMAVCLLPGTELSFVDEVRRETNWPWKRSISYKTAVFRQINKSNAALQHIVNDTQRANDVIEKVWLTAKITL